MTTATQIDSAARPSRNVKPATAASVAARGSIVLRGLAKSLPALPVIPALPVAVLAPPAVPAFPFVGLALPPDVPPQARALTGAQQANETASTAATASFRPLVTTFNTVPQSNAKLIGIQLTGRPRRRQRAPRTTIPPIRAIRRALRRRRNLHRGLAPLRAVPPVRSIGRHRQSAGADPDRLSSAACDQQ